VVKIALKLVDVEARRTRESELDGLAIPDAED